jgi:hypothetical protein
MLIVNSRRAAPLVARTLVYAGLLVGACSVFEPPQLTPDGSAGTSGTGLTSGTGGEDSSAETGIGGTSGTGGTETGPWWGFKDKNDCQSVGLPDPDQEDRPDIPDTTLDGGDLDIFMAQTSIRIGSTNPDFTYNTAAWREIGLDLDRTCTNSDDCLDSEGNAYLDQSCKSPTGEIAQDGRNCLDNQIGTIFKVAESSPTVGRYFGMTEEDWNCELRRGGFGGIYRVRNYNGTRNDPYVRLDVYHTVGTRVQQSWYCRVNEGGANTIEGSINPNWKTNVTWVRGVREGEWIIAKSSFDPSDNSTERVKNAKVFDPQAFVRNGYLYAVLPPRSEFSLIGDRTVVPGFRLVLTRPIILGELKREPSLGNVWTIKGGLIAGAVVPSDMIDSFRQIGFCENMCFPYTNVVNYLRTNVDIFLNTSIPNPEQLCTALSYTSAFEARQAEVADEVHTDDPLVQCPEPRHPEAPRRNCYCPDGGSTRVCP